MDRVTHHQVKCECSGRRWRAGNNEATARLLVTNTSTWSSSDAQKADAKSSPKATCARAWPGFDGVEVRNHAASECGKINGCMACDAQCRSDAHQASQQGRNTKEDMQGCCLRVTRTTRLACGQTKGCCQDPRTRGRRLQKQRRPYDWRGERVCLAARAME